MKILSTMCAIILFFGSAVASNSLNIFRPPLRTSPLIKSQVLTTEPDTGPFVSKQEIEAMVVEILVNLKQEDAFEQSMHVRGKSTIWQHILKNHVVLEGVYARCGDCDFKQGKTLFVSRDANGKDVLARLKQLINSKQMQSPSVSYVIKDGILALCIQIRDDSLPYYSTRFGAKRIGCYVDIIVNKVWFKDQKRFSKVVTASTIYPGEYQKTRAMILNNKQPDESIIREHQELERQFGLANSVILNFQHDTIEQLQADKTEESMEEEEEKSDSDKIGEFNQDEFEDIIGDDDRVVLDAPTDDYQGEITKSKKHGKGVVTYAQENDKQDDQARVAYKDGSIYKGQWKSGKQNGQGVMTYEDGSTYDGQWKDGEQNGQGVMTYKDGSIYDGQWKDGEQNGQGVITYNDGSTYNGQWKNGLKHGEGVETRKSSIKSDEFDIYEGKFQKGRKHGSGTLQQANGDICNGIWKINNFKCGSMKCTNGDYYTINKHDQDQMCQGKIQFANGNVYEGGFLNNAMHGYGIMEYSNKDQYKGQWQHGKYHGQGMLTKQNGSTIQGVWEQGELLVAQEIKYAFAQGIGEYRGELLHGQPHGIGILITKDKEKYESSWVQGTMQFNSQTKLTNKNGFIYQGQWQDGKPHGTGALTKKNGECYSKSIWEYGVLQQINQLVDSDGNYYEVEWDINKNGTGKCIYKNTDVYEGEWKSGKPSGTGTMNYANGDMYIGKWKNGQLNGQGEKTIFATKETQVGRFEDGLLQSPMVNKTKLPEAPEAVKGEAQYQQGMRHLFGIENTNIDLQKAFELLNESVKQDYAKAKVVLAKYFYLPGVPNVVAKNSQTAMQLYESAIKQGLVEAKLGLVIYYSNNHDSKQAKQLFQTINKDLPEAQFLLALFYRHGNMGYIKNYYEAVRLYELAAKQGHAEAQNNLACLYEEGIPGVIAKNPQRAIDLFGLAAKQGSADARLALAFRYLHGCVNILKPNPQKAFDLYQLAAKQESAVAKYNLALSFYMKGIPGVVDQNYQKAIELYESAAEQELPEAQYALANIYAKGIIVKNDNQQALKYYQLAANQKFASAQFTLGCCYIQGIVVDKPDLKIATQLYRSAVEKGHAEAQYMLSKFYEYNIVVLGDSKKAKELLSLTANRIQEQRLQQLNKLVEIARKLNEVPVAK